MRRKLLAGGAVFFAVLSLVLMPLPASAAVPDPVIPLPYTPTQIGSALSGYSNASDISGAYLKAYMLAFNAAKNAGQSVEAASATAIAAVPKPIAAPAALARTGGSVLVGFQAGWAIGTGGLALYAAATGTDYQTLVCNNTPDWYQGATSFMLLSLPVCTAPVVTPNEDNPIQSTLTYGGSTLALRSTVTTLVSGVTWTIGCYTGAAAGGNLPAAGFVYKWHNIKSNVMENAQLGFVGAHAQCGAGPVSGFAILKSDGSLHYASFPSSVVDSTTGEVVANTVTTRANPTRTVGCKVTHSMGSTTRTGSSYQEPDGFPLSAAGAVCKSAWDARPSGAIPSKVAITSNDGTATTTLSEQNIDPDALPAETDGPKPGLILKKVVGTSTDSCNTWQADCSDWWEDTDEGTSTTSPYRCEFAGESVPLIECGPYRNSFDAQTSTPTITDPITGNPTEWASTPSTGNSLSPGVGPGTGLSPSDKCFGDGWASVANPIDWVLVPVKCALVWAFVPRTTAVEGAVSSLGEAAGDVAAVDPLLALVDMLPAAGGCGGIPISLTFFGQTATGSLLGACDGVGATAASVVNGLLTLVVCTGALFAVTRYAAAVFGFVGPGGNIEQTQYQAMQRAARND